jgi:S1-C subfamily serine protease
MKVLRPFVYAAVMVAAFLYITSVSRWDIGSLLHRGGSATRLWTEPASAASAGTYTADEQNNMDIYRAARDATVNITSIVIQEDWFWGTYQGKGAGSGFIVSPNGEILTNFHVVNGTAQLTVTLFDKKSYRARVLFTDQRDDLALIKISADRKLPALRLGDSDNLVVGQKVLAIGNPFGIFGGTLTTGVVSSLGRTIDTEEGRQLEGMVQTDAAINPGNSGGPLLDSHGNVIGINTAIYGPQGNIGLGFATPINRAKSRLDEYTRTGHISRPTLGISTVYVAGDLAELMNLPQSGGLLIQRVERGSAAEDAGLRGPSRYVIRYNYRVPVGADLITEIEGQPVESNESLQRVMNRKRGGDILHLTIYRDGKRQQVQVKLGEAPEQM